MRRDLDDDHRPHGRQRQPTGPIPPAFERLRAGIEVNGNGCWVWTKSKTPLGYGRLSVNGKQHYTHRLTWTMFRGPIPPGAEIDHLCRNTSCCNPDHLEPVTHRENVRRSPIHCGAVTHCPHGHPYDEKNTFVDKRGRRQCRTCGNIRRRRLYAAKKQAAA